jgi:cell shape-determining protein MreD
MNYLRVLVYCLPIGLFWDINYASYGGAIAAQMGILMAEVSSSSYLLRRDRILFPLQNFMLLVVHLCIITIGLAESVKYSEVS